MKRSSSGQLQMFLPQLSLHYRDVFVQDEFSLHISEADSQNVVT